QLVLYVDLQHILFMQKSFVQLLLPLQVWPFGFFGMQALVEQNSSEPHCESDVQPPQPPETEQVAGQVTVFGPGQLMLEPVQTSAGVKFRLLALPQLAFRHDMLGLLVGCVQAPELLQTSTIQ